MRHALPRVAPFLLSLLVVVGALVALSRPVESSYPVPQGPAGNIDAGPDSAAIGGYYPHLLKVNLGSPGYVVGKLPVNDLAPGDAGEVPTMVDGSVRWAKGGASTAIAPLYIDAGAIYPACGTIDQVLRKGPGTTGVGCGAVNLSNGGVSVSGSLPTTNGGTGSNLQLSCLAGQVVQAASSTALACNVMSGDTTISSAGVTTTKSLNSAQTYGLTETATTGTLTWNSGATAPGLSQASTTTSPGVDSTWTPQPCVTTSPCTSGNAIVNLTTPVGAGSEAGFVVEENGTAMASLGVPNGYGGFGYLWLGPNASMALRSSGNYALRTSSSAGDTIVSSTSGNSGFAGNGAYEFKVDFTNTQVEVESGWNLTVGGIPGGSFGGGTNGIGFVNGTAPSAPGNATISATSGSLVVTPATSTAAQLTVSSTATTAAGSVNISGSTPGTCASGSVCLGGNSSELIVRGGGTAGTSTKVAPAGDGFSYVSLVDVVRVASVGAAGTGTASWPVPAGYVCAVHVIGVGNQTSGTYGTVTDFWLGVKNHGGTAAKIGATGSASNPGIQNLGASGAIADSTGFGTAVANPFGNAATFSGGNLVITVTNNGTSTNSFEVFFHADCSSG